MPEPLRPSISHVCLPPALSSTRQPSGATCAFSLKLEKQPDVKVLLALKAFSCWALGDLIGNYLDGTCASGLWEAKLAKEQFSGELATYSAGFKAEEIPEILELSDHLIFNSPAQFHRFTPQINAARKWGYAPDFGLRINPEHSEGHIAKYDPCAIGSRLGTPISQLSDEDLAPFSGIHMHTLCEQDFTPSQAHL